MNGSARWKAFMRYWNTVWAGNYDCAGDLVWEISQEIEKIKGRERKLKSERIKTYERELKQKGQRF